MASSSACVCVCARWRCVGHSLWKKLLRRVWQERLCYADHPVSVIPHLHSSAEWKYSRLWFLSPLLPLIYKWIHLVFMRGLLNKLAAAWSRVSSSWHLLCQKQGLVNKWIISVLFFFLKQKLWFWINANDARLIVYYYFLLNDWNILLLQGKAEMNIFVYTFEFLSAWGVCASFDLQTHAHTNTHIHTEEHNRPRAFVCESRLLISNSVRASVFRCSGIASTSKCYCKYLFWDWSRLKYLF